MKKISAIIITLLFLSIQPVCAEEPPPLVPPKGDFSEMRKTGISEVEQVINPMTVKLKDGKMISLTGLDYPDLDFYDPGELAVTAQKVLEDFLTGEKVIIYQTVKSDAGRINRMGHHIAHLVRENDDIWVQGIMLSLGLARVRTTKYNRQMALQMLKLEDEARSYKLGLWNMKDYTVLTPEEAEKHIGSYQVIEGKIHSISMHKNNMYINFGHNWRKDFTIGISSSVLREFNREHINPRKWSGLDVRVRGWVESYNGPFIEITHPETVELLSPEPQEDMEEKPAKDEPITFEGSSLPEYNQ